MKIIWKDIQGYEGLYKISNESKVLKKGGYDLRGHLRKPKLLKQTRTSDGYLQLGLHKDGKETKYLVHRLVATNFIPNPNNYPEINHKDENKTNNYVCNLEWCSHKYNSNYGTLQERRVKKWRISWHKNREENKLCVETNY